MTKPKTRIRSSRDGGIRRTRNFKFSDDEWSWLHEQADAKGLTVSAMVRGQVLEGMPIQNDGFYSNSRDAVLDVETSRVDSSGMSKEQNTAAIMTIHTNQEQTRILNSRDWDDEPHVRDAWDGEGMLVFPEDLRQAVATEIREVAAAHRENGEPESFDFEALANVVLMNSNPAPAAESDA